MVKAAEPKIAIEWQNDLRESLKKFLDRKCGKRKYQAILAVEIERGRSFAATLGTLTPDSAFDTWKLLVSTLMAHAVRLAQNFQLGVKIEPPPIQQKQMGEVEK